MLRSRLVIDLNFLHVATWFSMTGRARIIRNRLAESNQKNIEMSQLLESPNSTDAVENERYAEIVQTAKVVIIDDEISNVKVVQTFLQREGYRHVLSTTDSTEAIDLIRNENPDAVLLDLMMPEVGGLEILSTMRADDGMWKIPVIVLTADTGADTKLTALQEGATDFLTKPIDHSELLIRLKNVLSVKTYQDKLAANVAVQQDLLDRTFNGAVRMLTEIIESIESPAVDSSEVRVVAEKLIESLGIENNWTVPIASRLLVVGLPLLTQDQRDVLVNEPVSSASHKQIVKQMIEISSSLIRRIPRLDPVVDILDGTLDVDGTVSSTDSDSAVFSTALIAGVYVDLLRRTGCSGEAIVTELRKRFPAIDRTLLGATRSVLGIAQDQRKSGKHGVVTLEPSQLEEGMIVATKITDNMNRLLVVEGRALTGAMIMRLKQMSESQEIFVDVIESIEIDD